MKNIIIILYLLDKLKNLSEVFINFNNKIKAIKIDINNIARKILLNIKTNTKSIDVASIKNTNIVKPIKTPLCIRLTIKDKNIVVLYFNNLFCNHIKNKINTPMGIPKKPKFVKISHHAVRLNLFGINIFIVSIKFSNVNFILYSINFMFYLLIYLLFNFRSRSV
jgi:hypothetical protein